MRSTAPCCPRPHRHRGASPFSLRDLPVWGGERGRLFARRMNGCGGGICGRKGVRPHTPLLPRGSPCRRSC
eukprot:gene15984-biopygen20234